LPAEHHQDAGQDQTRNDLHQPEALRRHGEGQLRSLTGWNDLVDGARYILAHPAVGWLLTVKLGWGLGGGVLLLLAAVGGGICVFLLNQPSSNVVPRERAAWDAFAYQLREGPHARRYNLSATIEPAGAEPTVRILLDVQDPANYYFVEVARDRTRIGKVESGFEAPLGTEAAEGLGSVGPAKVVVKRRPDTIEVVLNGVVVAEAEDELFLVLRGRLRIRLEDGEVELAPGDAFVVPAGKRHMPVADEECWVALVEPVETKHTGDVVTERTRSIEEQLR
jgi:mannose-6-phosphate isomerase-like protein (cupin superfamily)